MYWFETSLLSLNIKQKKLSLFLVPPCLLPPSSMDSCNLKSDNSTLMPKYIFFFYLNPAFMPNISLVSWLFLFLKMMRNINFTKYWNPKISFSFKFRFFVMLNNHVGSWFSCMFLNLWSSVLQYGSFWYFMVVCTGQYGPVRSFVVLCGQVPFPLYGPAVFKLVWDIQRNKLGLSPAKLSTA